MDGNRDVLPGDGRDESANERADRNWSEILQELRVTQTGTQLISGFLLAVAFQSRFAELDDYQLALYLILVAFAATATLLGLAPVLMHRVYFAHQLKQSIVRTGNRLLVADVIVVIFLTAGVASLIFDFTLNRIAGWAAFAAVLALAGIIGLLVRPSMTANPDAREAADKGLTS